MLNTDQPAGTLGGDNSTPEPAGPAAAIASLELPDKLRVHALAKLLGARSRDVMAKLSDLGEDVRSAQSSISREVAERVAVELLPAEATAAAEANGTAHGTETASAESPQDAAAEPEQPAQSATVPPALAAPVRSEPERSEPPGRQPAFGAPTALFLPPKPEAAIAPAPAQDRPAEAEPAAAEESAAEHAEHDDDESGNRRRRRRGRRGRGRGKGGQGSDETDESTESTESDTEGRRPSGKSSKRRRGGNGEDTAAEESEAAEETSAAEPDAEHEDDEGGNRRRRRRRRRRGGGEDESGTREDDPPNTVVHVRESRPEQPASSSADEVRSVKGSTRLEAKRQRRRDGREAGRRRAPVLSESEFLARRESVDRKMVVREHGDQTQIAVLEDGVLVEHFMTSQGSGSLVGNVYLGAVQNVLPSMEAAFVDIGRGRNAVLYAGEVDWDAAGLEGKARKIEQALSTGDRVLVQVTKDPVGHKGARLTTQISLPGRFLVYVPGGGATGISRKLPDTERKRLKEILKRIVPEDAGVIIRTASEGVSEEELARDVRRLQAQWEVIKEKAASAKAGPKSKSPELLYEEPDLLIKVVRDLFTEDFSNLIVQGPTAGETIEAYVNHVAPDLVERLKRHVGPSDVFAEHRIDEQILKALDRKVWLPSGGYLVIDRTEAMTVIDVNTGKFTGSGGNLEETVTRNNLESAEEIVRQLRLRDIGGIIVIDFIDMVLESNRDLVLRRLTECLGRDRTRHQVAEVTSLGLVQMTRKRVGTGLLEAYSTTCEHCRGRGIMVSTEPVAHPGNGAQAHVAPAHPKPGDGRRGGRGRGGKQDTEPQPAKAEAKPADTKPDAKHPEPKAPEPKASEPKVTEPKPSEPKQPEPPKAAEPKPVEAAKPAAPKPVEPVPAKPVEPVSAEPTPAAATPVQPEPVSAPEPVRPVEPVAEPAAQAPEPVEAVKPAAAPRERRRVVVRNPRPVTHTEPVVESTGPLTTVAGGPLTGAAWNQPVNGHAEESDELATAGGSAATTRRRRRAVSRPAGPPVSGEAS